MPAYNFKKRFHPMVKDGSKLHTVRARRKYPTKVGDPIHCYGGMRTKHCERLIPATVCVAKLADAGREAVIIEPKQTITREELLSYPDGTWIMTNHDVTKILDTAIWSEPKPSGFLNGFWWRRKQLMDQLGMEA